MPAYDCSFSPDYAGRSAVITDSDGQAVSGSPVTLDANGTAQITLPGLQDGECYRGTTSNTNLGLGNAQTVLTLNLIDSLDVPGASETAYFTGTATSATGGSFVDLELVISGEAKDWAPIVAGEVVLDPETAGGCFGQIRALTGFDFSGTTPPDSPAEIGAFMDLSVNGDSINSGQTITVEADGADEQQVACSPEGGFIAGGTVTAGIGADGGAVTDGVATFAVSVSITRLAPAPPEPTLP